MSRINRSPSLSPSFRSERPFRSSTVGALPSSSNNDLNNNPSNKVRKSVLLSENQFNRISRQLENIRHGSTPSPNSHNDENEPMFQASPVSSNAPSDMRNSSLYRHTIGNFSVQIQEYAIMEDLLYVLIAVEGSYVKCIYPKALQEEEDLMEDVRSQMTQPQENMSWDSMRYDIDPTLDPSLKHLVEKILPLATYYMSINAFVDQYSRFEYGTINHALCAGMRVFLKEYLTFIAQLEHEFQSSPTFTLQRLWFYAQDLLQSMKIIHELAMTIRSIKSSRSLEEEEEEENNIEAVIEGLQQDESNEEVQISEKQKGGAILNILSERLIGLSGDPKCKKIYKFLLSKASVPYFEILHSWIYHGEIKDPYNEFMVLEKKSVKKENLKEDYNDTYWETRYTIREGAVPAFLEPMKNQILLAGKFLNVVRECGVSIANPEEMQSEVLGQNIVQDLRLDGPTDGPTRQALQQQRKHDSPSNIPARSEVWAAVDGTRFVKNLEVAYKYANQSLLNLLMKDQQLIGRLRSLKHYFFLDQSDFLTSFLDLAKAELKEPALEIPQTRLQSLMDLVLRNPSSVAAYDPFKEDVKVSMSHLRLIDQLLRIINVSGMDAAVKPRRATLGAGGLVDMSALERSQSLSGSFMSTASTGVNNREPLTGYDALILDYTVTFPLSLVISRKALTKYQLLFRHILNMKHVEDLLCSAWMDQKNTAWKTRSSNSEIEHWKFRVYSLRNRMLTFVQQFAYYVTNEVLEPNWHRLESNLMSISTVDQVLQYHSDFLDTCLKECMLTNSKLLRIFNKLMGSCVAFTTQAEKYSSLLTVIEEEQTMDRFGVPKAGLADTSSILFENTNRSLGKIEESFFYHMKLLIDALNFYSAQETVQFLCLVVRLDYNQFYNNASMTTRDSRASSRQR